MLRRNGKRLFFFGLLLFCLTSCATVPDNILIVGSTNPVTFNPLYSTDGASGNVQQLLFGGLVRVNEKLQLEPYLAEDTGKISEDGLEIMYSLKKGVRWHDGVEVTAEDVVFTFQLPLMEDYSGPRASTFQNLEEIVALDRYTVIFHLKEPDASFPYTAGYSILPKHILAGVPIQELEAHPFNTKTPIGFGPFKFTKWVDGQYIMLERFDDYFEGRPALEAIALKITSDTNASLLQLQANDIHLLTVPAHEVDTVRRFTNVRLSSSLAFRYDYIAWNQQSELFADPKVRQALTHALNRELMVESLLFGYGEVAHTALSPLSWAYSDALPTYEYNPTAAKELLFEAGWRVGEDGILEREGIRFSFELLSNNENTMRRHVGVVIQQMLKEVGVEVKPRQMEMSSLIPKIMAPSFQYDAVLLGWDLSVDPDPAPLWHTREIENGFNYVSYSNPILDEKMDSNRRLLDRQKRREILEEIYYTLAKEQPYTFLYYPLEFIARPAHLEGYIHHPRAFFYKAHQWILES